MLPLVWQTALDLAQGLPARPKEIERVAKATSPEAARWAFEQWDLRRRARAKFALADQMLFDREGLEMASHEAIGRYHGNMFPADARVADLTCGVGSDLVGIARRGETEGFDLDPARVEIAQHNLSVHRLPAKVSVADAIAVCDSFEYVFADPARRVGSHRLFRSKDFSPFPGRLLSTVHKLRVLKLSPMTPNEALLEFGLALQFVSFDRECREALVLGGKDAIPGVVAVHLESGETLHGNSERPPERTVGRYLYDPDPALQRAGAAGELSHREGLGAAGKSIYLTADHEVASPWLRTYEVRTVDRWDTKRLRSAMADLDAYTPAIKSRLKEISPSVWVRQLRCEGSRSVAIFAIRSDQGILAVVAEPKEQHLVSR